MRSAKTPRVLNHVDGYSRFTGLKARRQCLSQRDIVLGSKVNPGSIPGRFLLAGRTWVFYSSASRARGYGLIAKRAAAFIDLISMRPGPHGCCVSWFFPCGLSTRRSIVSTWEKCVFERQARAFTPAGALGTPAPCGRRAGCTKVRPAAGPYLPKEKRCRSQPPD
jgi:hypothetical protein